MIRTTPTVGSPMLRYKQGGSCFTLRVLMGPTTELMIHGLLFFRRWQTIIPKRRGLFDLKQIRSGTPVSSQG
jgi:hypothetical protein